MSLFQALWGSLQAARPLSFAPVKGLSLPHRHAPAGKNAGYCRQPGSKAPVRAAGLTRSAAEDLLDWLEATKCPHGELSYQPGSGYTVRVG